ncbi:hypothetical protein K438DRAFT_1946293 [Mycena galopus ATCC 62051]|nr:hypothetical protein K438DRAFT_1946293 [Mycena galopus ATCC 62051]
MIPAEACKHLRALRLVLENWVARRLIGPFYYPPTSEAARNVRSFATATVGLPASTGGAAVPQNFLALQKNAGGDIMAADDDECTISQEDMSPDSGEREEEENPPIVLSFASLSQAAVATQIQQRAEYTAKALLPRLHGLCVLLQNVKLTRTSPLTELHETLDNVHSNLTKALPPLPPPILAVPPAVHFQSQSTSIVEPEPVHVFSSAPVAGTKRPAIAMILAPSPEPHQRRKKSHNVM